MDDKNMTKIQGWFETLNGKFDKLDDRVDRLDGKVDRLDRKFENRFHALLTAMTNLHKRVLKNHDSHGEDITLIRRAVRDLDRDVRELKESRSGSL